MQNIFTFVLNMSITSCYVILAVIIIRLFLIKAPKKYSYFLWSVVGFRLAIPVSFQSVFSLFSLAPFDVSTAQNNTAGTMDYIPVNIDPNAVSTNLNVGMANVNTIINDALYNASVNSDINITERFVSIFSYIWIIGVASIILYGIISYCVMRRNLSNAVWQKYNIYESDKVSSPFILGIISPKIYIPFGLDEKTYSYVIQHEKCHISRGDNYVKAIAFVLAAVHWFNPLCWLAFYLMSKDMETSCDETVLSKNKNIKKEYSEALLSFAVESRGHKISPLCFSENSIKSRIKNILSFKKPKMAVSIAVFILCLAVIVGCAANPVAKHTIVYPTNISEEGENESEQENVSSVSASSEVNAEQEQAINEFIGKTVNEREREKFDNRQRYLFENYFDTSYYLFEMINGDMNGEDTDRYVTAYIYVVSESLIKKNNLLVEYFSDSHPCAIVIDIRGGEYVCENYVTPSQYEDDKQFASLYFTADAKSEYNDFSADIASSVTSLKQQIYASVISDYNLDADKYIKTAFENIDIYGPLQSSNPNDYIDTDSDEYKCLINCSAYTMKYIYTQFLKGGQTDIFGSFYRIIMDDIIGGEALKVYADTGQDYFDAFLKHNQELLEKNSAEFMEKNHPYGYMLLKMSGDIKD